MIGQGFTRPIYYDITCLRTGQSWKAAVESWPWKLGKGLGFVDSDFPIIIQKVEDLNRLREYGYKVETYGKKWPKCGKLNRTYTRRSSCKI